MGRHCGATRVPHMGSRRQHTILTLLCRGNWSKLCHRRRLPRRHECDDVVRHLLRSVPCLRRPLTVAARPTFGSRNRATRLQNAPRLLPLRGVERLCTPLRAVNGESGRALRLVAAAVVATCNAGARLSRAVARRKPRRRCFQNFVVVSAARQPPPSLATFCATRFLAARVGTMRGLLRPLLRTHAVTGELYCAPAVTHR